MLYLKILELIFVLVKLFFEIGVIYTLIRVMINYRTESQWVPNKFEVVFGFFAFAILALQHVIFFVCGLATINGKRFKEIGIVGWFNELLNSEEIECTSEPIIKRFRR